MKNITLDEKFMKAALNEALKAYNEDEVPVRSSYSKRWQNYI